MRIVKAHEAPKLETVKGRHGVILIVGENAMMMKLTIEPGIPTPPHSHPHEQMGYLLEGKGILHINNESREIETGTSFWIPPKAPHSFDALGDDPAVLIEAFSPPREDYLSRV
ncbi:MAG: cupin domain-containing protein [Candidatus Thorarchaeota archaeon]|nr:MAG: cupin domain-containing protein [Candidatus Thorarchaeota archaeon]